ncbi:MAG: hypothetical protein ACK5UG_06700 [Synechococcaceae cyanobacterium]|jgi:hypothetical protein
MDSRRLVVWISAGILGFQGTTLILDLANCTLLSWLAVQHHGIPRPAPAGQTATDPVALYCARPHHRIDAAVSQGLSVLAGLALGGTAAGPGGPGRGDL